MAALLPWEAIRAEYVEGYRDNRGGVTYPTCEDLARKYTCSDTTIRSRCARERWGTARTAYQVAQVENTQQEAARPVDTRIRAVGLIESTALACASRGLAQLDRLMGKLDAGGLYDSERQELLDLDVCIGILTRINGIARVHSDDLPPAA